MASLRATERALEATRAEVALDTACLPGQMRHEMRHLKRARHRFGAFIVGARARTPARLLDIVQGEYAEGDRHARVGAGLLQTAGTLAGHELEMRRVSSNHAAERADRLMAAARDKPPCDDGQLKCPGHPRDEEVTLFSAALAPGGHGALQQGGHDGVVESCRHDRNAPPESRKVAFARARAAHVSSPM